MPSARQSLWSLLRLRQIHPILAKFRRALGKLTLPLGAFVRWRSKISHLIDRVCGEFLRAPSSAGHADGPRLDREPELDQAADGFGAGRRIGL